MPETSRRSLIYDRAALRRLRPRWTLLFFCVASSLSTVDALGQEPLGGNLDLDSPPEIQVSEVARIDGYDADLVPIRWITISEDNESIFVAQEHDYQVLVFDRMGSRRSSIGGGPGQGPGEFQNLVSGGIFTDTLWIYDGIQERVTMFSATGTIHDTFRWPPQDVGQYRFVDETGRDITFGTSFFRALLPHRRAVHALLRAMPALGLQDQQEPYFAIVSEQGLVRSILGGFPPQPEPERQQGVIVYGHQSPERTAYFAVSPQGTRIAAVTAALEGPNAGAFKATIVDPEGNPAYEVSGSVPEPVEDIRVGGDHSLWLRTASDEGEAADYYVLSATGDVVGKAHFPPDVRVEAVGTGMLVAVSKDALDVPSVHIMRWSMP